MARLTQTEKKALKIMIRYLQDCQEIHIKEIDPEGKYKLSETVRGLEIIAGVKK